MDPANIAFGWKIRPTKNLDPTNMQALGASKLVDITKNLDPTNMQNLEEVSCRYCKTLPPDAMKDLGGAN